MKRKIEAPTSTGVESVRALVLTSLAAGGAVIGGLPAALLGASAVLYSEGVGRILGRRLESWANSVSEGMEALNVRVEGLENDEAFVSTLMRASSVAVQTHQREKLEALRNAVLNAAIHTIDDDDEEALFLSFIEALTPAHLRVLRFRADPLGVAREAGFEVDENRHDVSSVVVRHVFPDCEERERFYGQIDHELQFRGLTTVSGGLRDMNSILPLPELGTRFLEFITCPRKENST